MLRSFYMSTDFLDISSRFLFAERTDKQTHRLITTPTLWLLPALGKLMKLITEAIVCGQLTCQLVASTLEQRWFL